MAEDIKEKALRYHNEGKPGKVEVRPTKPYHTQDDLSLAYSPGVAYPCLEIHDNPDNVYKYTNKGNLVAVISNGTAVLGLGDIGPQSGKPVMEGKGLLFKIYGGVDVFDIEVNEKDPEKFCEAVERIAPTFGGINLEDIKAPECFYIEDRLKKSLDIPVMHDDQHGTAIISAAGLLNALKVNGKKIEDIKVVVNGAGAAAISCTKLYVSLGVRKENVVMLDSRGVISVARTDLNEQKREFATSRTDIHTLEEAVKGADMFLGLSKGGVLTGDMVRTMADYPIVFALANPIPEIDYQEAVTCRPDILIATGRSDYPNQINNVIGFPYIFRGALDVQAKCINEDMKLAAAKAIADIAHLPVPEIVNEVYKVNHMEFGKDYFIPKPIDPRLVTEVSMAVAKAAIDSGVARKGISDWDEYRKSLLMRTGQQTRLMRNFAESAHRHSQKVVFAEGENVKILEAAASAVKDGICQPVLLGNGKAIAEMAATMHIEMEGIKVMPVPAKHKNYRYGMQMVKSGKADAMVTFIDADFRDKIDSAKEITGLCQGYREVATMHIVNSPKTGPLFIADTAVNTEPDSVTLAEVARLSEKTVSWFNKKASVAMISEGYEGQHDPRLVKSAEIIQKEHPEIHMEGIMALDEALKRKANTLVFPNLTASKSIIRILKYMDNDAEIIGPVQMGLAKSIHFVNSDADVRDILNVTAVAVLDAYVIKKKL